MQTFLKELVSEIPRVDAVCARAKSPDRYFTKACKLDESGERKYKAPRYAIQDQIGARINVLYLSDIEPVRQHMLQFMKHIEETPKSPEDNTSFGYFGHHFIFQVPDEIISDDQKEKAPEFFELQIKTLFQHAWSEAHHDLGYKSKRELTPSEQRRIAFTAAQAWGADKIFEELVQGIGVNDNDFN